MKSNIQIVEGGGWITCQKVGKISMLKVFLTLLGTIVLLAGLVAFAVLYPPSIFEEDLEFLETKKQPLTAKEVAKHLGHTEIGPGFYEYRIIGGDKRAEFWIGPPRPPAQVSAFGFPVEIAVVVVRSGDSDVRIIWPEEMKGRDFDEVIGSIWPRSQ